MEKSLIRIVCIFLFSITHLFSAGTINIGDSEGDVRNKMGKPSGTITIGSSEKILSYSQGDIVIKDGKVARIEFLPGGKTHSDLNKSSQERLQKRIDFDKELFNKPLVEFMETKEFKALTDDEKIIKLKEFKEENPTTDIKDDIEALEKKIAENKEKEPATAKQAEASKTAEPAPVAPAPAPAPAAPAKSPEPAFQGAANPYQGSSSSSYPGAGSSGGYNLQQTDFYKMTPKEEEKK